MEPNIPGAAHPCQYLNPASAVPLFPQVTRIVPVGPWGSPALPQNVVGSTSTQQHSCWLSREFWGSIFFLRSCLVLSAVLPLQGPCSRLTCFSVMAEAKLQCCSWDPPQAAGARGSLTCRPPSPALSLPTPSPPHQQHPFPALMQIPGQAVARKCHVLNVFL